MTIIDIYSGFLGAGKTTLIKKMISEAHKGEKLALIENEFGEIGIDGGFMQDAGIEITEMNSGCICCSLVGDFGEALHKLIDEYHPDRILIEPTGVGKLSDVIAAARQGESEDVRLGSFTTVADANKVKLYMKNFGEFYNNQIETASCIVLSRTGSISEAKLEAAVALLREKNAKAAIVTTPWDQLTGEQLLAAMTDTHSLAQELAALEAEAHHHDDDDDDECPCCHHHHGKDEPCEHDHEEHEHHHHHHDEDEEHEHHHHHHDEDEEHEHHHHHDEDEEHEHHHHHDEDEEHEHHHHHHHHGHDADEVFMSWGVETARKFTKETIENALRAMDETEDYGIVLRAKGIVAAEDGSWLYFDHVPGEVDIRTGAPAVIGRLCVIGSKLKEDAIAQLFGM